MENQTYNGWTNWATFTIGSNLMNDEGLYLEACRYERGAVYPSWQGFVENAGLEDFETPDGVCFTERRLDHTELDELIQEINA